jgi:dienelactone hydrolase
MTLPEENEPHKPHSPSLDQFQLGRSVDRRQFVASAAALSATALVAERVLGNQVGTSLLDTVSGAADEVPAVPSIIGLYGSWAAGLVEDPPRLSFRLPEWSDIDAWRKAARTTALDLVAAPAAQPMPDVQVLDQSEVDGLEVVQLSWQLSYGRPTQAVLLKPRAATGPLPGVLGLHDHGGNKYFGHRKITRSAQDQHPLIIEHQAKYYAGLAWANELAKRGYVVLVHDAFSFASRRVMFEDMSPIPWGDCRTDDKSDVDPEKSENIRIYNAWAGEHEHIMSKSLFSAGTTWPGVFLAEDQAALSVLAAHEAVDASRLGCAGLSGGGLRTVFLGGLDERVKCAICVGFMSTWRDFLMNKSYTHTWMTYAPLLPRYLDFPEVLGLRSPLPTLVQNCNEDGLYTLPEMQRADAILQTVYNKAGSPENYSGMFYPGGHKFDTIMQRDAFDWFDRWLT